MACNEVIGSPFSKQLSAGSPKLRIYESLFLLNQGFDHVVALLRDMEKFSIADTESMQSALAEIEEVRSGVNADFVEQLGDRERSDEGRFWKQRRAFEKKRHDPDDVYCDVERREQERKKQGLPSRVGVIPHFAIAEQEERQEWLQQYERNRSRRAGRKKPRSMSNARGPRQRGA